jgi:hypothetical protein
MDTLPMSYAPTPAPGAAKPWWRSKTVWFNLLSAFAVAAEAAFSLLQPLLAQNTYAVISFAIVAGNIVLRKLTHQPLALRLPPPAAADDWEGDRP